jgi:hypothetical protein
MIDGRDNVELEFAITAGLKDPGVDLDLLYAGSVELLQCGYNACLLASTRRSVDEEVGKVTALRL